MSENAFEIRAGGLDHPAVAALLNAHLAGMAANSPAESIHALTLDGLRAPSIRFYSVWAGSALAGCGALKRLNAHHGELKSMRTHEQFLRCGVARQLLGHLIEQARELGLLRVSLETGSSPAFMPAISLYRAFGFEPCGPFGQYRPDPFSRFMSLSLQD